MPQRVFVHIANCTHAHARPKPPALHIGAIWLCMLHKAGSLHMRWSTKLRCQSMHSAAAAAPTASIASAAAASAPAAAAVVVVAVDSSHLCFCHCQQTLLLVAATAVAAAEPPAPTAAEASTSCLRQQRQKQKNLKKRKTQVYVYRDTQAATYNHTSHTREGPDAQRPTSWTAKQARRMCMHQPETLARCPLTCILVCMAAYYVYANQVESMHTSRCKHTSSPATATMHAAARYLCAAQCCAYRNCLHADNIHQACNAQRSCIGSV